MYHWYKALLCVHIIGIISWMAGILYLFRLFVYHCEETESVVKARFTVMERKLYRYITLPAMIVSVLAGLGMLALAPALLSQGWLHAKLLLVFALILTTGYASTIHKNLVENNNQLSSKQLRLLNELPTLLMVFIVIFVIIKPFS